MFEYLIVVRPHSGTLKGLGLNFYPASKQFNIADWLIQALDINVSANIDSNRYTKMEQSGHPPPPTYQHLPTPGPASPARISPIVAQPRPMYGRDPMQVMCGNCNQLVITSVETENGACTYIAALIVFLICFPFFWVPLVIDNCRDYRHTCPACKAVLGVFKKV